MRITCKSFPEKKTVYLYDFFDKFIHSSKPVTDLKTESYFSKIPEEIPNHEGITKTTKTIEKFDLKTVESRTMLQLEAHVSSSTDAFQNSAKLTKKCMTLNLHIPSLYLGILINVVFSKVYRN